MHHIESHFSLTQSVLSLTYTRTWTHKHKAFVNIYIDLHTQREKEGREIEKSFFYYYFLVFSHPTLSAEEGSGITQDDLMEFLTDDVDDVIIKCYVCPNSSAQSCEMESLRQNPDDYLSQCSGHCMNISTGTDQS